MTKSIVLAVALMAAGGFAMGWLAFGSRARTALNPSAIETAQKNSARPVEVERRYVLRPEDIQADRETPALAVDDKGHVVVAWASQTGDLERTIYLLRSSDGGTNFAPPVPWRKVPIYKFQSKSPGKTMAFSTHVLPRLTASAGSIWLGWVEAINGGPDVRYLVARSTDGGTSFAEPVSVHGDKAVRPGFTSLSAGADGTLSASWLDGRSQGQQPFFSLGTKGANGFGTEELVFAGPDGKGICPCCDLSTARSPQGSTFVAFRNNDSGHRDIYIAQSESGEKVTFSPPIAVTPGHWKFEGCPHDGPSLALSGDRLHLLWMDAHTGKNRVYAASSELPSLNFSARELSQESKGAQGHPKLLADSSGTLHAVWDESLDPAPTAEGGHGGASHSHNATLSGGGRAIMYAISKANGEFGTARALAPHAGAFQLNPAIAVGPTGDVFVAWNELDTEGKQVVLVRLPPTEPNRR
ncbi:sialidase family protein [Singulisphaera sp. Ch08]|uniref:Sialidase family protein n=1 Tax=Singulisphaera sp. Ch08 TaxID=3120278 RepID=A0AAU7C7E3_9BACT